MHKPQREGSKAVPKLIFHDAITHRIHTANMPKPRLVPERDDEPPSPGLLFGFSRFIYIFNKANQHAKIP